MLSFLQRWLSRGRRSGHLSGRLYARRSQASRPHLEALEDRLAPATLTVTNLLDDGSAGSLRMVIAAANKTAAADTIVFKAGLQGIIRLSRGEIEISRALTIVGPGAKLVAIDGNAASRIFAIDDQDASTLLPVRIEGLKLRNGNLVASGGAIESREDLTLVGCIVRGNRVSGFGGAINADGRLTIRQCTIANNKSNLGGGGIGVNGALTVAYSVISENVAVAEDGGGINAAGGTATIRFSSIADNIAGRHGGGVFAFGGVTDLAIKESSVRDNQGGWGGSGGGLCSLAARTTIQGSRFISNFARIYGGGIYAVGQTSIDRTTVAANRCIFGGQGGDGGGGIAQVGGFLTLTNSIVRNNRTDEFGGGLHVKSSFIVRGCTISGNEAILGGGIDVTVRNAAGQSGLFENSTVSGNTATQLDGGGVAINTDNAPVTLRNCTVAFNGNQSTAFGGGIDVSGPAVPVVTLESTIVANNYATTDGADLYGRFLVKFSLIQNTSGATITQMGPNVVGKDPLLAPLAYNGGPTPTHALKKGSPAINRGSNPAYLKTDQRGPGFLRKLGFAVDIGAFERE